MAESIWIAKQVNLGTADSYFYRVRLDSTSGAIIYYGKAYKQPGASSVIVKVNDICADYLTHDFYNGTGFHAENWARTFVVQSSSNGSSWTTKSTFTLCACYDWQRQTGSVTRVNVTPIRRLPAWARIPVSTTIAETVSIYRHTKEDGGGTSSTVSQTSTGAGTCWFTVGTSTTKSIATISNAAPWINIDNCIDAVLYYVNEYGGWSVLPLEGATVEGDDIQRTTFLPDYNAGDFPYVGEKTVVNAITHRYTMHTAPLTAREASWMPGVMRTPLAYIHIYTAADMDQVVITDTSIDYVSRGCGSERMPVYTFTARSGQRMFSK